MKLAFATIFVLYSASFAQSTQPATSTAGSIVGTVIDPRSGEALQSVNIVIVGANLGALTNLDGRYLIRDVPAGIYALEASMVGYTLTRRDSVIVRPRDTVRVDIQMRDWCASWADIARKDLAAGTVKRLLGGLIVFPMPRNELDKLTQKYGFKYELMGCTFMCEQAYNEVVEEYLNSRNGSDWRDRFNSEYEALERKYWDH